MKTNSPATQEPALSPLAAAKSSWPRRHAGDLLAILALAAFTLVIFWKALADPAGMIGGDAAYLYQDYYTMAAREVQAGRIPLWNPYILMGVPFHASLQPALFYPLRWPMFYTDYVHGYAFTLCLHYFLGAVAAYLLVRTAMRVKALPATLGAMSIVFGGFALGHASHPNYFLSYPWFFGSILFLWLAINRRQWRWVPPAGACMGLMMLVGSVHLLLILGVLLGTLAAYFALAAVVDMIRAGAGCSFQGAPERKTASKQSPAKPQAERRGQLANTEESRAGRIPVGWREVARPVSATAAALVLGVLIGMIQLWPAYGLYKTSSRGESDSDPRADQVKYNRITFGSANPQRTALQMFAPFYYGDMRLGYWGEVSHDEMAHYTGIVTLVLAAAGVAGLGRDRGRWAFVAVGLAGVVFGTGKFFPHLYDALYNLLPPFRALRIPTRIWWCADIALSCLGAFGLQRLLDLKGAAKAAAPEKASSSTAGPIDRSAKRSRLAATVVAALAVVVLVGALVQLRDYAGSVRAADQAVRGNDEIDPRDMWFPSRVQAAQEAPRRIFQGDAAIWTGVAAAILGAALAAGLFWRRGSVGRLAQAGLVALLGADLLAMSFGMVMYNDQFSLMRETPQWASWLAGHAGDERVLREVMGRPEVSRERSDVNRGMLLGYRQANGLGGGIVDNPNRGGFIALATQPVQVRGPDGRPVEAWDLMCALRNIAGVKYVVVNADARLPEDLFRVSRAWGDANWTIYQCRSPLAPAFFVEGLIQAQPGSAIESMLGAGAAFDPAKKAIVYGAPPAQAGAQGPARREAAVKEMVPGRWTISTDADAAGQLVVTEGYDPGWRCEIDAKEPAAVYQTDDQVMSVTVPAGKHTVELKYDPPEFRKGAYVTIFGIVLLVVCTVGGFVVGRRSTGAER